MELLECTEESLILESEEEQEWDGYLQDFEDDPSLTYVSPYPIGFWIKRQMEKNKHMEVRSSLKKMYEEEKDILYPCSYLGTKPDIEIRYVT